jgi:hypothetical protein
MLSRASGSARRGKSLRMLTADRVSQYLTASNVRRHGAFVESIMFSSPFALGVCYDVGLRLSNALAGRASNKHPLAAISCHLLGRCQVNGTIAVPVALNEPVSVASGGKLFV